MFESVKSFINKIKSGNNTPAYLDDPFRAWKTVMTSHMAYNRWLNDYLLQGGRITHFEPYLYPDNMKLVYNPFSYEQSPRESDIDNMQGPVARSYILSPEYDAQELAGDFISDLSDNILYGWTDEGRKAVVIGGENLYVPAYTNTSDKELMRLSGTPDDLRQYLRDGNAASEKNVAMRILRRSILKQYKDSIIDGFVAAGKVRRLTSDELQTIHPAFSGIDMWGEKGLYVTNPENVSIPSLHGAFSIYVVLDPKYDVRAYRDTLMPYSSHNTLAGWSGGEPVVFQRGLNDGARQMPLAAGFQEYIDALKWFSARKKEPARNHSKTWQFTVGYVDLDHLHTYDSTDAESNAGTRSLNPYEYLNEIFRGEEGMPAGQVEMTFIDWKRAVLTTINGEDPTFPLVLLTLNHPVLGGDLTGKTYNIRSIKPLSVGESVAVTF